MADGKALEAAPPPHPGDKTGGVGDTTSSNQQALMGLSSNPSQGMFTGLILFVLVT